MFKSYVLKMKWGKCYVTTFYLTFFFTRTILLISLKHEVDAGLFLNFHYSSPFLYFSKEKGGKSKDSIGCKVVP